LDDVCKPKCKRTGRHRPGPDRTIGPSASEPWNRVTIAESIESVLRAAEAAGTAAEIVVLDDASTDGTREMVEPDSDSCDLKILAHRACAFAAGGCSRFVE
jgi:Glycosyl transferase family 2